MKDEYKYYLFGVVFWVIGAFIIWNFIEHVFLKTVAFLLITFTLLRGINSKRKAESKN